MIIMAVKITGISPDLIIHPGETIAEILEDRDITQAELANLTGVTPAYINQVIKGKRNISTKFAFALEYALGVPKTFWINLQAHYDAEKIEYEKEHTITDKEKKSFHEIADVVKYLRVHSRIPAKEKIMDAILSVRKALRVSNLSVLSNVAASGSFRMSTANNINPFVLGAWLRICQLQGEACKIETSFEKKRIDALVQSAKQIMCNAHGDLQKDLKNLMAEYGVDFSIIRHFKGAPVQGYISQKKDGTYQMVLTIRGAYADIFWFSFFHELGHIVNGDVGTNNKYIDYHSDSQQEIQADEFAANALVKTEDFEKFVLDGRFDLASIRCFAAQHNVMPYIIIGRLQKNGYLPYTSYSREKLRYKWKN